LLYQQFNKYKVLSVFFDYPNKKFQLRELSRITEIALPSVKKYVEELTREGFVKEVNTGIYKGFRSSLNREYGILKRNDLLYRLETSGLIRELEDRFTPNCIVLYGSAVKGLDDERGDIDIFVQSRKGEIDLEKYESMLKRKISLLFEPDLEKLSNELRNSLANGIVLSGFLKVI